MMIQLHGAKPHDDAIPWQLSGYDCPHSPTASTASKKSNSMAPNQTVVSHMPVGSVEFMTIQSHGCMHKSILQRMEKLKLLNKIHTIIRDEQIPRRLSQTNSPH